MDEAMMNEIGNLKDQLKPQEILFVVDAMTGQDAVNTAKSLLTQNYPKKNEEITSKEFWAGSRRVPSWMK